MSKQIITINRMFGSNGRVIGKAIADALGLKFYDKELIEIASREKGVPFDEFAKAVWENLNPDNKVSLFVRYIDIETGIYESRIINKNC